MFRTIEKAGVKKLLRVAVGVAATAAVVVGWLAWRSIDQKDVEERFEEARRAVEDGRGATAKAILDDLARRRPKDGAILLLLGHCELSLGRTDRAMDAFARVPADAPEAAEATVLRCRELLDEGRLAKVEELITPSLRSREGPFALEAYHQLVTSYKLQGRKDEALDLYRRAFARLGGPIEILRELTDLNYRLMIDSVRETLERGHRADPDDDRVWLGLAFLETTTGRFDEANRWLDRCERARPGDPPVLKARLRWARATDDLAAARDSLRGLPPDALRPGEVLELAAWFARHRDDPRREREALEAAIESGGVNRPELLGRLAILAAEAGDTEKSTEYRRAKAEDERNLRRYAELLFSPRPDEHADRLAELAEALGRTWEARYWARIDDGAEPTDLDLEALNPSSKQGPTLVDLKNELDRPAGKGRAGARESQSAGPDSLVVPTFRDRAGEVGLEFAYEPGGLAFGRSIAEMMGGGVALIDYDGDGWLDVFVAQGGRFPPDEAPSNADRLFRNLGDGTFEDATRSAGLDQLPGGYGFGAIVGDVDGDGAPDLLVSRWRGLQLLRNRGDGTFEDATEEAGLDAAIDWPTSAAFADLDGDGDLDLYVCQYLEFDPTDPSRRPAAGDRSAGYASPLRYPALHDRLYRNDGGRFVDISESSGVASITPGRGLGVVACDLDGDGLIDLFVANDMTANFLFRNRGDLQFEEIGEFAGVSAGGDGAYQASMGIACGDLNGDGLPDLAVTNYLGEGMAFYRGVGDGMFAEQASEIGLLAPTRYVLGFGTAFFDPNNDGLLDLVATNGHVLDFRPRLPFAMPSQLLLGTASGRLRDVTEAIGPDLSRPRVGRGLAVGDLDNDGRPDVLIVFQDAPLAFLRNETEPAGRFLVLQLEAIATAPSAESARVTVSAGDRRQVAWKIGGGSYLSSSDPRLHFGLGMADRVDSVEIRWPSGHVDRFADLPVDSFLLIREGDPSPRPLPGHPSDPTGGGP